MRIRNHVPPIALVLILAMLPASVLGAISSSMVWEVRATGSDTACSGGFRAAAYIAAPSSPTVTGAGTGGTVAAGTYYFVVTYTDGLGETAISGQTSVVTTGTTSTITVTSPAASTGALTWSVYAGTTSGGPYFQVSSSLVIGTNFARSTTPPTTGTQPRGVDYTLQNAAQVNVDNSTITATTAGASSNVITFTGYTPTAADVGNTYRSLTGTNINAGTYEITAVTATTWTVTGATNLTTAGGAGSALTGKMGGALASIGQAQVAFVAGNQIAVLAGTYAIGNGTVNTSGNAIQESFSSFTLFGYTSNRYPGNTDTPPVFTAGANAQTMIWIANNQGYVDNVKLTNPSAFTGVFGLYLGAGAGGCARHVIATGIATGIQANATDSFISDCQVSNGTLLIGSGQARRCTVISAPAIGISVTSGGSILDECVVVNPVGVGILVSATHALVKNCVVYGSTSVTAGMNITGDDVAAEGCIVYKSTSGGGIAFSSGHPRAYLSNCAVGNSFLANYDTNLTPPQKISCVTLSADPFTNAAGNDFGLNAVAGGGAACRAAGIPGTWSGLSTTGYRDIGAAQHADSAGGGGFRPRPRTGFNLIPGPRPAAPRVMPAASEREWRKAG